MSYNVQDSLILISLPYFNNPKRLLEHKTGEDGGYGGSGYDQHHQYHHYYHHYLMDEIIITSDKGR